MQSNNFTYCYTLVTITAHLVALRGAAGFRVRKFCFRSDCHSAHGKYRSLQQAQCGGGQHTPRHQQLSWGHLQAKWMHAQLDLGKLARSWEDIGFLSMVRQKKICHVAPRAQALFCRVPLIACMTPLSSSRSANTWG